MKKIIIAKGIYSDIENERSFFKRADIKIFITDANDGMPDLHRDERADLLVAHLDSPKMGGETLCSIIRDDRELRRVSIIIVCGEDKSDIDRASRCRANAIITSPVEPALLFDRTHKLLSIPHREFFRAPLGVKIQGKYRNEPFLCYSENISASGVLLETERALHKGDKVLCSFFLPDSTHVTAMGEIVRVARKTGEYDSNKYGIRFIDLKADFGSAIEAFVKRRSKK